LGPFNDQSFAKCRALKRLGFPRRVSPYTAATGRTPSLSLPILGMRIHVDVRGWLSTRKLLWFERTSNFQLKIESA